MANSRSIWLLLLVAVIVSVICARAPESMARPDIALSVSVGPSLPVVRHFVLVDCPEALVEPRLSYAVGLIFGRRAIVADACGSLCLEYSHITEATDTQTLMGRLTWSEGVAHMRTSLTSIMIFARLFTSSRLSPYVQIGLGAAEIDFAEVYSSPHLPDVKFHSWRFAYGGAAGVQYTISHQLRAGVFFNGIVAPGDVITKRFNDIETGFLEGKTTLFTGLSVEVTL
jgi:hypothetical protein